MENAINKNKVQILIPVVVGAAAAAALAYFLISDNTAELREDLSEGLGKILGDFKTKITDTLSDIKSKSEPIAEQI